MFSESGQEGLFINGRLQASVALEVLKMTELNTTARNLIEATLNLDQMLHTTGDDSGVNSPFMLCIPGPQGSEMKDDIISSALLATKNENNPPDFRVAAHGLLEALGIEQP